MRPLGGEGKGRAEGCRSKGRSGARGGWRRGGEGEGDPRWGWRREAKAEGGTQKSQRAATPAPEGAVGELGEVVAADDAMDGLEALLVDVLVELASLCLLEERDYKGLHAFPSNITRDGSAITGDDPPSLLILQGMALQLQGMTLPPF